MNCRAPAVMKPLRGFEGLRSSSYFPSGMAAVYSARQTSATGAGLSDRMRGKGEAGLAPTVARDVSPRERGGG